MRTFSKKIILIAFLIFYIFIISPKNLFAQEDDQTIKGIQKVYIKVIGENGQPMPNVNVTYKSKIQSGTEKTGIAEGRIWAETLVEMYNTKGKDIVVKGYEITKTEVSRADHLFLVTVRTSSDVMRPVIVNGTLGDDKGEKLKNIGVSFITADKSNKRDVVTDADGNFELQFGNEKEWKDFFKGEVDILIGDNTLEVYDAKFSNKQMRLLVKKKDIATNKTETKKEEKKITFKIEPETKNNETAAEMKKIDNTDKNDNTEGEKFEKNPEWVKWVEMHLKSPKDVANLPEKEKQAYIITQIKLLKNDDTEINEQIKTVEEILKNDTTLSEKEKLNLTEELNKLKRRLYLNKLALGDLETQLADFQKTFWEKYRTLLLIFAVVALVLSFIIYLMALLARTRKRQRDDLSLKNKEIEEKNIKITEEQQASEKLLLNILPATTAQELKKNGKVEPRLYPSVTTLFTDFKGFSGMAKNLTPQEVISQLAFYFEGFEKICETYKLEKIKTIGDAFMAVAGLPLEYKQHALCAVGAGLAMQRFINDNPPPLATVWGVRVGLHTGEAIAGVIGQSKFAYDVWGNAVNVASRMESSGEAGEVQISSTTYNQIKHVFVCTPRGKIEAKNIGMIDTYFVERLLPEYAQDKEGFLPNDKFWKAVEN